MVSSQVHNTEGKVMDVGVEGAIIYDDKFWFTYDEIERLMLDKKVRVLDGTHTGSENPSWNIKYEQRCLTITIKINSFFSGHNLRNLVNYPHD